MTGPIGAARTSIACRCGTLRSREPSNTETAAFLAGRNGLGVPTFAALIVGRRCDIEVLHA